MRRDDADAERAPVADRRRVRVRVSGIVQGVGFRPYVFQLATGGELAGFVGNDEHGVFLEAEGPAPAVAAFLVRLPRDAPPLAQVDQVGVEELPLRGDAGFVIAASQAGSGREALVSPDVATCADCLRELSDPDDRRYRYPFINCTNCGPRYTIVRDVPYDRPATTMAGFAMCADCAREYHDPLDRRFHAQPVCCPACGPAVRLVDAGGDARSGEPIAATAALLSAGAVVAVKGLGGFHLAVDAAHHDAAAALRARKHRADKPFAVMVADLDAAHRLCELDRDEVGLLTDPARPIVLARRRREAAVAAAVAPGNRSLGLMLPYTPLHHLLAAALGTPFVLTSGNVSDEPIAYRDADAFERLGPIADAFLTHDRPIHMRVDDSVTRVLGGRPASLRRSRGLVPRPITVPWPFPRPVLACGAELKSTVCLAKGHRAFVSHHIGDLENYETYRSFLEGIEHLGRLFDITPAVVAHDLHPEYLSTKHALERKGAELVAVQHHHAHVASCLADNGEAGPVIGVAFDGTGYGTDATIWGGEILVADLAGFERVGHLATVPLPGGTAAIREPWRMAASYLEAAVPGGARGLDVVRRNRARWDDVVQVGRAGVNSPACSSAGRLFDAVAAILGIRDAVSYEGQAAIELEQCADPAEAGGYAVGLGDAAPFRIAGTDLVRAVVDDLRAGTAVPVVAARFHNGVVAAIVAACRRVRSDTGLTTVALSGGVFQNALLTERALTRLGADGFRVLTHRQVPCNDGGISFGQAVVAAARDRA